MGAGGWDGVGVVLSGFRTDDSNAMLRGVRERGLGVEGDGFGNTGKSPLRPLQSSDF